VKGGYLSKPRWATSKRKNRQIELDYRIAIRKEDIQKMSLEEINDIITRELNHNDYIYQKEKMIPHPGRKLAEGIENVVYVCPHCQAINTLKSEGNQIRCDACKRKGYLDRYGFIHDFVFDNLVAWDTYQRNFTKQLKETTIRTQGFLSFLNVEDESHEEKGKIELIYENHRFHLTGAYEEIIEVDAIENPTITLRRSFGFFYQNRHYLIDLEQYGASLLRIAQNKY
ncbi:MAG: hypothetical protein IH571_02205, partial [Acholeplasmataceae bacterium]|nr:hypothetical protein [Acholeplasmataceae bacterium]